MKKRKTIFARNENIKRARYLVDASAVVLGKLATKVAVYLRGKHKPLFTPHVDCGDYIVVVNAEKIKVSGRKLEQKKYYSHSGYPGGIKEETLKDLLERKPEEVIKKAVWGMIPKGKLGRALYKKLKVYRGPSHPHEAQNPQEYKF